MATFMKRFTEWQNYVHYIALAAAITAYLNYNGITLIHSVGLEFLMFAAFVMIADTVVHGVFWFAPKPLRWRD